MSWTKRPDCADCSKPESALIYIGRPVCYPCYKLAVEKEKAKAALRSIRDNLTIEEIKEILGGEK